MAGREMDGNNNSMELSEEDERRESEWEEVGCSKAKKAKSRKRKKNTSSAGGSESEGREAKLAGKGSFPAVERVFDERLSTGPAINDQNVPLEKKMASSDALDLKYEPVDGEQDWPESLLLSEDRLEEDPGRSQSQVEQKNSGEKTCGTSGAAAAGADGGAGPLCGEEELHMQPCPAGDPEKGLQAELKQEPEEEPLTPALPPLGSADWGLELQCVWSLAGGLGTVQEKHGQFGGSLEHRGAQLDDDFSPPQYRASQRQCLEVDEGPTSHLEQLQNGGPLMEEHSRGPPDDVSAEMPLPLGSPGEHGGSTPCEASFDTSGEARIQRRIEGQGDYICTSCGKTFLDALQLKTHEEQHGSGKRFGCSECGKGFTSSRVLEKHQITHTREKHISCTMMAGREMDGNNNSMELSEEDERTESEWEEVGCSKAKKAKSRKRKKNTSSAGGSESEGREGEEKVPKTGLINVVVKMASIMEVLTKTAVAEITKLVDDGSAALRLEMCRSQRENEALKRKLGLLLMERELGAARGYGEGAPDNSLNIALEVPFCDEFREAQTPKLAGKGSFPAVERVFDERLSTGPAINDQNVPLEKKMASSDALDLKYEPVGGEQDWPESVLLSEDRLEEDPSRSQSQVEQKNSGEKTCGTLRAAGADGSAGPLCGEMKLHTQPCSAGDPEKGLQAELKQEPEEEPLTPALPPLGSADWGLELQCAWSLAGGLGTVQEKHGQFGGSLEHRGAQLDDHFSPPQYRASQRQCLEVDEGPTSHLEQHQNGGPLTEEHSHRPPDDVSAEMPLPLGSPGEHGGSTPCEASFDTSGEARIQRRIEGQGDYICTSGEGFTSSRILEKHQITHPREKHMSCTMCNKTFASLTVLVQHHQSAHAGEKGVKMASIMDVLTKTAIAEITKLVDDGSAVLRLEMCRSQRENEALKRKLGLLLMERELGAARGYGEGAPDNSLNIALEVQFCDEFREAQTPKLAGKGSFPAVERVFDERLSTGPAINDQNVPLEKKMASSDALDLKYEPVDGEQDWPESVLLSEDRLEEDPRQEPITGGTEEWGENVWQCRTPLWREELHMQPCPAGDPEKGLQAELKQEPEEEPLTPALPPLGSADWGLELQCAWSETGRLGTVQEKHGQFGGSLEHRGAQLDDDFSPPPIQSVSEAVFGGGRRPNITPQAATKWRPPRGGAVPRDA
ncbi:hypothetical protein SKAU_G00423640 [Synaphobranchus kaupii]|uniref:C2H2-type domain-containing protein n=1 Tax=Synaphobranchus kaupii TaxID=118154 RepID=A0A9Q1E5Q6_SYNKA|nr:hypothetical protein SKAU_G00423640 [Synaphobranchus kaupii]